MVHTEGAILIDDYTSNLTEWEASGGIGIRFNRSLNGKGFKVIDRLDKILEMNLVKQGLNGSIRKYKNIKIYDTTFEHLTEVMDSYKNI